MTSPFLWTGYEGSVATLLSTELNSLANSSGNTLAVASSAFDNSSNLFMYADIEFVAGASFSPSAGGYIELWLLRSIDGGSTYEDGSATVAPGRPADIIIPVRTGSSITPRAGRSGLILSPGIVKPLVRNQTGATLPSSGNLVRYRAYNEAY